MARIEQYLSGVSFLEYQAFLDDFKKELAITKIEKATELLLDTSQKEVFGKIFDVEVYPSPSFLFPHGTGDFVACDFGLKKGSEFSNELVVRVVNKVLAEESLFDERRAKRPLQKSLETDWLKKLKEANPEERCRFCHIFTNTPEEIWGRTIGKQSATAANASGYDALNGLVIPTSEYHNPENLTEEVLIEMFDIAQEWMRKAKIYDYEAIYPTITWNHLPRAGQSVFHPHLGVEVALRKPYQKVEKVRKAAADYLYANHYPFWGDLAYCLSPLGLVYERGTAKIIFNPAPVKEKEVIIFQDTEDLGAKLNRDFVSAVFEIKSFWENLGSTSFDLAIYLFPLNGNFQGWEGWRNVARMVERGQETVKSSDIGSMELYVASVVASDPFVLARAFSDFRSQKKS